MDGLASLLFPQAPSYAEGLLGADEAQRLQSQAQRSGLLNLGLGLLAAGAPSAVRTGTGAGLVQGLMAGQEAYQRTYQQRLQEMEMMRKLQEQQRAQQMQQAVQQLGPQALAGNQDAFSQLAQFLGPEQLSKFATAAKTAQEMRGMGKPEYVFEKLPDGTVIRIDKRGVEPPQQIWAASKAPKLDDAGMIYAQVNFGKTEGLSPEQMAEAFNFQSRPSPASYTDLLLKAETIKADTGVNIVPQVAALGQRVLGTQAQQVATPAAPQMAPQVSPVADRVAQVTQPVLPQEAQLFQQASPQNPMVANEAVPLKLRNELKASQPAVLKSSIQAAREIRDLRDTAEKLLANEAGLKSAVGFGGQTMSLIPGTPAADAAAVLDNLKNRSFTAGILALRQSSPTGSGVGSLTEREGARFENLQASLGQAQSFEQIRDQLRQLRDYSNETLGLLRDAYSTDFGPNKTIDEVIKKSVVQQQSNTRKKLNEIFGR
jgi:hypothetical protein